LRAAFFAFPISAPSLAALLVIIAGGVFLATDRPVIADVELTALQRPRALVSTDIWWIDDPDPAAAEGIHRGRMRPGEGIALPISCLAISAIEAAC